MEKSTAPSLSSESEPAESMMKARDLELGEVLSPVSSMPGVPAIVPPEPAQEQQEQAASSGGPGPIPDGGLEAWLQVLGSWCILLASWGLVNTYGVYQTFYETELLKDHTSSDISWIGSLQAALLLIVGVISGPLFDAGYFKHLIVAGNFFMVFGMFMTSISSQYWQVVLAQGITIGIGMGLAFLPSAAILAQYFAKHRALVIGIASTGSPVGGIVFPIIFSRLQPLIGFGWATRVIAFILLGTAALPIVFMHTRLPPSGHIRSLIDASAFHDGAFMVFTAASFFAFLVLYVAFFYIQLFAEQHHLASADFAPYLVTLVNVGSVLGRLAPNAIADVVGALNVLVVCTTISAVLMFAWLGINNLAGLIAFGVLYGIFSGGVVSLTPSVIVGLSPDLSHVGARMGTLFMLAGASVLVGTPIGGAVLGDFSESRWLGTIGYGAGGLLLASIGYAVTRLLVYRKKGGLKA